MSGRPGLAPPWVNTSRQNRRPGPPHRPGGADQRWPHPSNTTHLIREKARAVAGKPLTQRLGAGLQDRSPACGRRGWLLTFPVAGSRAPDSAGGSANRACPARFRPPSASRACAGLVRSVGPPDRCIRPGSQSRRRFRAQVHETHDAPTATFRLAPTPALHPPAIRNPSGYGRGARQAWGPPGYKIFSTATSSDLNEPPISARAGVDPQNRRLQPVLVFQPVGPKRWSPPNLKPATYYHGKAGAWPWVAGQGPRNNGRDRKRRIRYVSSTALTDKWPG